MEALTSPFEIVEWIEVEDSSAAGRVRGAAIALGRRLGFSEHRIGEVAIAATELGTNLSRHAKQGVMLVRTRRCKDEAAIELLAVDAGPGMRDIAAFARDGESTAGTLGIGIGAITRLATWFDAYSNPGQGTVMTATFWAGGAPIERTSIAGLTRAMRNEHACGDAWAALERNDGTLLLLADGLGHGELAAIASRKAVECFRERCSELSPGAALERIDRELRATRGAAAAIVHLSETKLTFAGVGNVAVWVDDGERRHGLHSTPGIVGTYSKRPREVDLDVPKRSIVAMHSDGLTSKWDLRNYPGLLAHDPLLIAAVLLRDAGIHHDDASVVIART